MCTLDDFAKEMERQLADFRLEMQALMRKEVRGVAEFAITGPEPEAIQLPRSNFTLPRVNMEEYKATEALPEGPAQLPRSLSGATSMTVVSSVAAVSEAESRECSKDAPKQVTIQALATNTEADFVTEVSTQVGSEPEDDLGLMSHHRRGYMAGQELYPQIRVSLSSEGSMELFGEGEKSAMPRKMLRHCETDNSLDLQSGSDGTPDNQPKVTLRARMRAVIEDGRFDVFVSCLILSNAVLVGIQADRFALTLVVEEPWAYKVLEIVFGITFAIELGIRVGAHGRNFFYVESWRWNLLDTVVVGLQGLHIVMESILSVGDGDSWTANLGPLRSHRVLRLVQIIRIMRTLKSVSELRTVVVSILGTFRTLLSTIVILFLVIYMCAVTLTQLVSSHLASDSAAEDYKETLQVYFGSLSVTIITLFQAITNGLDWADMLRPLMVHITPWLALPVCAYIAFGVFALMNIVTGCFVESALQSAKREQERFLLHTVLKLFEATDSDSSGDITWKEFESKLYHPDMQVYFQSIDVDIDEAPALFRLIDINASGSIDPEEFVNGCIRLQGPAKAIDLATLMYEYTRGQERIGKRLQALHQNMKDLKALIRSSEIRALTHAGEVASTPYATAPTRNITTSNGNAGSLDTSNAANPAVRPMGRAASRRLSWSRVGTSSQDMVSDM